MTDIFLTDKDKNELAGKIESKEPRISWPLEISKGGTGAKSAAEALEKLGAMSLQDLYSLVPDGGVYATIEGLVPSVVEVPTGTTTFSGGEIVPKIAGGLKFSFSYYRQASDVSVVFKVLKNGSVVYTSPEQDGVSGSATFTTDSITFKAKDIISFEIVVTNTHSWKWDFDNTSISVIGSLKHNSLLEGLAANENNSIETGTYTGAGNAGDGYVQLNFSGTPKLVIVNRDNSSKQAGNASVRCDSAIGIFIGGAAYGTTIGNYGTGGDSGDNKAIFHQVPLTWGSTSLKWETSSSSTAATEHLDGYGAKYNYVAVL